MQNGKLMVVGRKDRQFISGGENIQPEEIESALLSLPPITAAKVIPQPDPEFGMRPVAFIEGAEPHLERIKAALTPLLPSFKHPVAVYPLRDGPPSSFK